jgi:hypothetical protein
MSDSVLLRVIGYFIRHKIYRIKSLVYIEITFFIFFFSRVVRLSPLGTAATLWPIVPTLDDKMIVEQSVELELAGETEILGENLPQCHFVHHKSHMT